MGASCRMHRHQRIREHMKQAISKQQELQRIQAMITAHRIPEDQVTLCPHKTRMPKFKNNAFYYWTVIIDNGITPYSVALNEDTSEYVVSMPNAHIPPEHLLQSMAMMRRVSKLAMDLTQRYQQVMTPRKQRRKVA